MQPLFPALCICYLLPEAADLLPEAAELLPEEAELLPEAAEFLPEAAELHAHINFLSARHSRRTFNFLN